MPYGAETCNLLITFWRAVSFDFMRLGNVYWLSCVSVFISVIHVLFYCLWCDVCYTRYLCKSCPDNQRYAQWHALINITTIQSKDGVPNVNIYIYILVVQYYKCFIFKWTKFFFNLLCSVKKETKSLVRRADDTLRCSQFKMAREANFCTFTLY